MEEWIIDWPEKPSNSSYQTYPAADGAKKDYFYCATSSLAGNKFDNILQLWRWI